ncbi:DUF6197 family protein [Sphingomonas jaspsi]|uniref:DUF6197 family protein n=1 Tax=Sphingomonas jaspsi TaxID=392409 RepID=UPI0004BA20F8|nr:hypothetical protein [Sphingomonas jaspsi]
MPDLLIRVREILADPEHWTKDSFARDDNGYFIDPTEPVARCFCLDGALIRAAHELHPEVNTSNPYRFGEYRDAADRLSNFAGRNHLQFNDDPETTHADVLALIDKAIANAD